MRVKWKGVLSKSRNLIGRGPQGSIFGIWEYLTQSNENANCVPEDYRFKFVDDLTILEKINLLMIGLASVNVHQSVPSEIPIHNQIIPSQHLKMQKYLKEIQNWTENQKMLLNKRKTKAMIFNFSKKHQFTTSLTIDDEKLEIVEEAKLLGVILTNDLKWSKNTEYLVKKANVRMELLRRVAEFTSSLDDLIKIYTMYIRSILEQSCVVWHSALTQEDSEDLERVQKCALKIILGSKYTSYDEALKGANLLSLKDRREELCKRFAKNCVESDNDRVNSIFKLKTKNHSMKTRKRQKFKIDFAKTERLKTSAVTHMQRLINQNDNSKYQFMRRRESSS